MIEVLAAALICLICVPANTLTMRLREVRIDNVRAARQLRIEDGVWLRIVQLFALLVVKTGAQEIDTLVVQVDVAEAFEVHEHF